jgi:hypothetical protein
MRSALMSKNASFMPMLAIMQKTINLKTMNPSFVRSSSVFDVQFLQVILLMKKLYIKITCDLIASTISLKGCTKKSRKERNSIK